MGSVGVRPAIRHGASPTGTRPVTVSSVTPTTGVRTIGPPTSLPGVTIPGYTAADRRRRLTPQGQQEQKKKKQTIEVPEIVPRPLRRTVAVQGQQLNEALRKAGSPLSGPEYLAKLIQFESGWNKRAANPSSAFGLGQFIDSTAADFRNRLKVETQDPSRPRSMIKGAAMHASGKFGYGALYAGYNPGYSDTDPIPGVDVGRNVKVRVPRKAVRRAASGEVTGTPIRKRPGVLAGSRAIVKELVGKELFKQQGRGDKEPGHSPGGYHDPSVPNAYAADLSTTSEAEVDRIARKLGLDPKQVNYGTTGLESGITYKGYDIEFLPYTHGSGPHIHIGAKWTGGSPPSGTQFGGLTTGGTATGGTGAVSTGSAPAASAAGLGTSRRGGSASGSPPISSPLAARPPVPQTLLDQEAEAYVAELFRPRRRRNQQTEEDPYAEPLRRRRLR